MGWVGPRRRGLSSENLVGQAGPRPIIWKSHGSGRTAARDTWALYGWLHPAHEERPTCFEEAVRAATHNMCTADSILLLNTRSSTPPMRRPTCFNRMARAAAHGKQCTPATDIHLSGVPGSFSAKNSYVYTMCFWPVASLGCTRYSKYVLGFGFCFHHKQNSTFL